MSLRSEVVRIVNELLAGSKKISQLNAGAALDGTELVEVVQGGENVQTTTQDIADLGGGGGGTWGSITGDITDQTDLVSYVQTESIGIGAPSTAGGTITLDLTNRQQSLHVGSASFSAPKTIALSNTTSARVFNFHFEITDIAAVLTFPSDFVMSDTQFDTALDTWTPELTGHYEMGGSYNGTHWKIKIAGPFL